MIADFMRVYLIKAQTDEGVVFLSHGPLDKMFPAIWTKDKEQASLFHGTVSAETSLKIHIEKGRMPASYSEASIQEVYP